MRRLLFDSFIPKASVLAASISLLLSLSSLSAAEKSWIGAADGSWLNGSNWSPDALQTDLDSVLYDASSGANSVQLLDQNWSIGGIRVTTAPGPITILPGGGNFVLTNTSGIDMSAATADLIILADYHPLNNGSLNVAAGRTLTLSNVLAAINSTLGATIGAGTVRIVGDAVRMTENLGAVSVVVDGGSIVANTPLQLGAASGSTVTVLVTNGGLVRISGGNNSRIRLGHLGNVDSTNRFVIDGGSVTVAGSSGSVANGMLVGDAANTTGILDINNGSFDLTHRNSTNAISLLRIGNSVGSTGIVNLNANGVLLTPRIDAGSGSATFNFNGGKFVADQLGPYFTGVQVNLLSAGGTIDTGTATNRIVTMEASIAGTGGLTKIGSGALVITGTNNTYTGPTVVSNGSLSASLPMFSSGLTLAGYVPMTMSLGVTADASWTPDFMTLAGSNVLTFTLTGASLPSSTLLRPASLTVFGSNVINIAGSGWPAGTTRLIDYSGSINGGGTFVLGPLPIGLNARLTNDPTTTSIDLVVSTAVNSLDWYGTNATGSTGGGLWDIATSLNWNNGSAIYNEYASGLGDTVRFTSTGKPMVELVGTVRPSGVLISNLNTAPYSFVGPGKISGPTSVIKEGNNATSLASFATTNDYTGGTFVRIGVLRIDAHNALPTAGVVYVGSPGFGATFVLNGFNQKIAGLVSTGSGSGNRRILNSSATQGLLTFDVPANTNSIYTHSVGNNSVALDHIDNNLAITKIGAGSQSIGNSFYTGPTLISGGTFLFNGLAASVTNSVTVQAGGAVGGSGTNGSHITVEAGGSIEPGNLGIGVFTVTNKVTIQGAAVMQLNRLNTPTCDRLVSSQLVLGGTLVVTNLGTALQAGDTFSLFSGSMSGSFNAVILPTLSAGLRWNTNALNTTGSISVEAAPAAPNIASTSIVNGDLFLSGNGGVPNGTYRILSSTNLSLSVASWEPIATNTFDGSGAFNATIPVSNSIAQRFFLLSLP